MQPQGNCIQKVGGSVATNRTGLSLKTKNKQTKKKQANLHTKPLRVSQMGSSGRQTSRAPQCGRSSELE